MARRVHSVHRLTPEGARSAPYAKHLALMNNPGLCLAPSNETPTLRHPACGIRGRGFSPDAGGSPQRWRGLGRHLACLCALRLKPLLHGWLADPTNDSEKAQSAIFAQTGPSSTPLPDFPDIPPRISAASAALPALLRPALRKVAAKLPRLVQNWRVDHHLHALAIAFKSLIIKYK